jgi:hypothetical protein
MACRIRPIAVYFKCIVIAGALSWGPDQTIAATQDSDRVTISGELRQWHKVTLTLDGPQASEQGDPNPFLDYRMQVTFRNPATGLTYIVPGYFAADGNAAQTSATSGNKWRAHLSPDHTGTWNYSISFRQGTGVAVADDPDAGAAVPAVDGSSGSFSVGETDKTGRDLRGKGRLQYVGKHHLRFAGTGEYFLKCGADAPENFLAYADFDGDFKQDGQKDNFVKKWLPHVKDWREGDPTWQDGKGKGIIGAINYLAAQGMNVFSFLTLSAEGDDRNVFPYTTYDERERLDCSRMDQWAIVFDHGNNQGMYLHFKTMETENEKLLDDGDLGVHRKLYYRELIARFGHNLALNWNLGEEINDASHEQKVAWANYLWKQDPYRHHIVIHNGGDPHYDLLGDASALTGFSLQTSRPDFSQVHRRTLDYIQRSAKAGKPWVVACDEPGDASHGLITDAEDPTRDNARQNGLWGNIMAGGAGVEWYFGYQHPHSDLTCEDYRTRQKMWTQCRHALEFFEDHQIPFWETTNGDGKLSTKDAYCLYLEDKVYVVFLKRAEPTTLDLSSAKGLFEVRWFDPRDGGPLESGSTHALRGGGVRSLGRPPRDPDKDWVALIRPADPNCNYPPSVNAGQNQNVMLPRSGQTVDVELAGEVNDDGKPGSKVTGKWSKSSGAGVARFENANSPSTKVSLTGAGTYVLKLTGNDSVHTGVDSVTVVVEPYSAKVSKDFFPIADAYIEGNSTHNNEQLKVEGDRRVAYLKFHVDGLPPRVLEATLTLTEHGDSGSGTLRVYRGSHSDWTGATLRKPTAPTRGDEVGVFTGSVDGSQSITIPVTPLVTGNGTYTAIVALAGDGNDIWFGSMESDMKPQLTVTAEDPDVR